MDLCIPILSLTEYLISSWKCSIKASTKWKYSVYILTEIFNQRSKFFGPPICWWILLSLDHAKETGTRGLTTKCGVVMKGGIVLVIIQLSTSMALNYLLQTGSVQVPFGHSSEIIIKYVLWHVAAK